MHEIYELKDMLCEELEKYGSKGDLNAGELEIVDKLAHAVKNLGKIIEMSDGGYSNRYNGMSYNRGNRGGSYARGRGTNARRDSMGRYSTEQGYSRAAEDMVSHLHDMMSDAEDEQVREEIQKLIHKLERM